MDARVKKDEHLENKNVTCTLNNIFDVRPFSPKGFFTFLVGVAHGVAPLFVLHRGIQNGTIVC